MYKKIIFLMIVCLLIFGLISGSIYAVELIYGEVKIEIERITNIANNEERLEAYDDLANKLGFNITELVKSTTKETGDWEVNVEKDPLTDKKEINYDYEILREWEPYKEDTNNSLGLEILLKEKEKDLTKEGLIEFINTLKKDIDPVTFKIYLSKKAYEEENNYNYTDEFDKGFLLVYIKNMTVNRTYYGVNEIRWMQVIGKFSSFFGQSTKF